MKNSFTTEGLTSHIQSNDKVIIFGYAPMCKTCQIAHRMLMISSEMYHFKFYEIDLNYHKQLIERHKVMSAPALMLFNEGVLVETIYRFESVIRINDVISKFIIDE